VATATLTGNLHPFAIDTSNWGEITGTVNATSTSEAVANGDASAPVSLTVLKHARPSFELNSDLYNLVLDWRVRARGSVVPATNVQLYNRPDLNGFRAGMDVDSENVTGSPFALGMNVTTYTNLEAGGALNWDATPDTSNTGSFLTTYTLTTSDQDLPGAMQLATVTITLRARRNRRRRQLR
jgi:hypothetical protein